MSERLSLALIGGVLSYSFYKFLYGNQETVTPDDRPKETASSCQPTQQSSTKSAPVVTASNVSSISPAQNSTSSPKSQGSKRLRRHSKRQEKRNSQRLALKSKNKDPEDELLKANKEDSSESVVPKYCQCRNIEIDSTKDTENLFDPKIKYKSNYKKTEVEYYPYKSMDLLTTEGGASELSRDVWDVSTLVRRPTSYLTPFQAILDAQDYAAQHAEVMDNLIKYGDDE